jgi:hypothetical protein
MIEQSMLHTAGDYWRASTIMQHGQNLSDYRHAYELAIKGVQLGQPPMNSLITRTTDRYFLKQQQDQGLTYQNQLFGTQFQLNHQSITYVYPSTQTIPISILDILAIISISRFIGQQIDSYYQARDLAIQQAFGYWHTLPVNQQQAIIDTITKLTQKYLKL